MCKVFIAVVLMAVSVYCAPQGVPPVPPTTEESKAALVAAGISDGAAAGIVSITEKHMAALQTLNTDIETYMKTQSEADQAAYKAYAEKTLSAIMSAVKPN